MGSWPKSQSFTDDANDNDNPCEEEERSTSYGDVLSDFQRKLLSSTEYHKTLGWSDDASGKECKNGNNLKQRIGKDPLGKVSAESINLETLCHSLWVRFAEKHQKSPTHVNNNVQSCGKSKSRPRGRKSSSNNLNITTPALTKCPLSLSNVSQLELGWKKSHGNSYNNVWSLPFLLRSLQCFLSLLKWLGILLTLLICMYCLITLHKPSQAFISRHTQDLIYPFMRALRIVSLPVVRKFPMLADFYEESCLISNPFYQVEDLECWPCESVRHVIDLTGFTNFSSAYHHSGIPFVVKDAFREKLGIDEIKRIYYENQQLFGKTFIDCNLMGIVSLDDIFNPENEKVISSPEFHLKWKINRVTTARLWRRYFPKPYFIPETTEVSIQRFLFLDQPLSRTYNLPMTEFANVFLTQVSGSRSIVLIPKEFCHHSCKVVSLVLQPHDVLFYNWLFWQPMSVPVDSEPLKSFSISYIGSFY